jgi:hypothetical protein
MFNVLENAETGMDTLLGGNHEPYMGLLQSWRMLVLFLFLIGNRREGGVGEEETITH